MRSLAVRRYDAEEFERAKQAWLNNGCEQTSKAQDDWLSHQRLLRAMSARAAEQQRLGNVRVSLLSAPETQSVGTSTEHQPVWRLRHVLAGIGQACRRISRLGVALFRRDSITYRIKVSDGGVLHVKASDIIASPQGQRVLTQTQSLGIKMKPLTENDNFILRLEKQNKGMIRELHEVEQTLGKALGYPWFKDDQKNFPDATEADGVCIGEHTASTIAVEAANRIRELEAKLAEGETVRIANREFRKAEEGRTE